MIHGILLSAGHGRRIGGPKALLTLRGETFHARLSRAFQAAGLPWVSVVSGTVAESLPPPIREETRVVNPDPDSGGMFSSARLGVAEALRRGATSVVFLPVDHPLVTADDLGAVAAGLHSGSEVVIATHGGRRGHPVGLGPSAMREAGSDPSVTTLRDVVHRDPERVLEVPASEGVLVGVNTREDLERASERAFR